MAFALRITSLARMGGGVAGFGLPAPGGRLISLTSLRRGKLVPFKLADIGEGIRDVTMKEWFVKPGDKVSQFDNICEVQSDKASVTITSRYDGVIKKLHHETNSKCLVGQTLVDIEVEDEMSTEDETSDDDTHARMEGEEDKVTMTETMVKSAPVKDKVLTTPAVRRIAMENAIDLTQVAGSGRDGRVLKEDIMAYLETRINKSCERSEDRSKIPDKKYAKSMFQSMKNSLTIPHFVYSDECDVSKLITLRKEVKEAFEKQGLSLSYMPFFIKALSEALNEYPELNAFLDEESESLNIKNEHNIALAMDTPGGLIVPNIKNVQNLNILDITKELNRLQGLGKKLSIPPSDLIGTTITLSNIGIIGGTYTKPIIVSPQVVVGAFGKIQKLPRFDEKDNIVAKNILIVSWSADHRVVDGVTIAKFSNLWKHYVQNPYHILLGI